MFVLILSQLCFESHHFGATLEYIANGNLSIIQSDIIKCFLCNDKPNII